MSSTHYAMGALKQGHHLEMIAFTPKELKANEVFVEIKYCGQCHS